VGFVNFCVCCFLHPPPPHSTVRVTLTTVVTLAFTLWALFHIIYQRGGTVRDLIRFLVAISPPGLRFGFARILTLTATSALNATSSTPSIPFQLGL
jgi:hypothetical protein